MVCRNVDIGEIKLATMPLTRTMLFLLIFQAGLFGAAQAADTAGTAGCTLKVLADLDLRTTPDGRIAIPVKFEGRDLFFLVDTGGVYSTIDPKLASALQLRPYKAATYLFNNSGVIYDTMVDAKNFAIGRLNGHDFHFYVEPSNSRDFEGLLAPQILGAYDVELDFANGKFRLFSQDHCPGKVIYWTKAEPWAIVPMSFAKGDGHIHVPVTIDGKTMNAVIDTGAGYSLMSLSAARRFLGFDENAAGAVSRGSGARKTYRYPFQSLTLEGITVKNPEIVIEPDNDSQVAGRDMILGIDVLRQMHVYIAYKEEKIYLTAATAH